MIDKEGIIRVYDFPMELCVFFQYGVLVHLDIFRDSLFLNTPSLAWETELDVI